MEFQDVVSAPDLLSMFVFVLLQIGGDLHDLTLCIFSEVFYVKMRY